MRLLLQNISIIPMTANNLVLEKGYIVIEDQFIKEVGEGDAPEGAYDRIIDGTNKVALPGFINTHTHAAMSLLRGYADDLPLKEWLETKIWPLEAKMTADDMYWGTMLAIVEMIKSGTTTFHDMYFYMDNVAQAVKETGIRAVLARGMIGIGPENELAITESRELIKKWHRTANDRISFRLGPHAPNTCPPDYLKRVIAMADELQADIHIHLAETIGEVNFCREQYGKTPIGLMESLGMFRHHVLAAHCVHVTPEDIDILKKYNVGVAHNPESNMKLSSGIAPVPQMLDAGIPVALGTDGASSNNNLDMLQEMRSCALLHKVNTLNPTVIPASQALEMATANGATALCLEKEVGQLKPGMKADIILMDLSPAHMTPRYDILANIVYSAQAADVLTVIVDGNILMEDRVLKTINEEEVLEKCRDIARRFVKG
ncbi:MAG: amidohydrolase family protein [Syntrophomonadaceae bacterium]|jgi:5-methylthioadenosine/S-adenosylhomocysteine deaminase